MRKTICLFISWGNAKESPIGRCICSFIISPSIHLFMFQTLILLKANDIWIHTWANEIFEKPCLLEPWRWSHLGQQHKGPLYLHRLGLKLSRISSVSPMCPKEPKSCYSPLNSSFRYPSCNFAIHKQYLNISLKLNNLHEGFECNQNWVIQ